VQRNNYLAAIDRITDQFPKIVTLTLLREQQLQSATPVLQHYISIPLFHLANVIAAAPPEPAATKGSALYSQLQALITEHAVQYRKSGFYAAKLGVDIRKLNTVTRAVTGKRLAELIAEHLINNAKHLLADSDMLIKEIAYESGFASPDLFNHFFRQHTGLTPSSFRSGMQITTIKNAD